MAIIVAIKHDTYYKYDRLINMGSHVIRLKPAPHSRTKIHSYSLNIEPKEHFINWQQDSFGNYLARVVMQEKVKEFKVEVEVVAEMTVINPFDFFVEEYAEKFPFQYDLQDSKELAPYFEIVENGRKFFRRDADAGVGNGEMERGFALILVVFPANPDDDAAKMGEFDGIADQVEENLAQPQVVAHKVRRAEVGFDDLQIQPFFGCRDTHDRPDALEQAA